MKFGSDRPSGFGEEDSFKMVDDGPWLYYKLTNEPKGSGELKKFNAYRPLKLKRKKKDAKKKKKKKNFADLPTLFQNKGEIVNKTIFF